MKNLTLENLAEKYNERFDAGLSKGTLSKYENGKQEPMITVVNNLATILGVSTDYLLGNSLPEGAFEYNPTHKIPILGYISAGLPLYAEQHIEDLRAPGALQTGQTDALARAAGEAQNLMGARNTSGLS